MDKFKSMQVFRAVVEQGSFVKAAEYLDISTPMASKYLAFLEAHLQTKLLQRNNRQQMLTESGGKFYLKCCNILDNVEHAETEARQDAVNPKGLLKIAAPVWAANPFFSELLAEFEVLYPNIRLSLVLDNSMTDLIHEGVDVALRLTNQNLPYNVVAKALCHLPISYVASPSYLEKRGRPENREQLAHHRGLKPTYTTFSTTLPTTHQSNNTMMLVEMAKSGMGIAIVPDWASVESVCKGDLIELFPMLDDFKSMLYAIYMDDTLLSLKIRVFLDFLSARLG